ncbi:hypothetical protein [Streptomyces sp. NPDC001315]|uniref:hypothetical protein n=1 Tax=Streptomyces sp. NPDC001315 TaxID=3364562 RepID=UPI0036B524CD
MPTVPPWTAWISVCAERLKTVAGAPDSSSPRCSASSAGSLASTSFVVIGFSQYTCFPASRAALFAA